LPQDLLLDTEVLKVGAKTLDRRMFMKPKCLGRSICLTALSLICPLMLLGTAMAFPTKPIMMLHYASPGSATDLTIRAISKAAGDLFGQPVVVESKVGGAGFTAMAEAYNSPPDGYKQIVLASSLLTTDPHLRKVPFDYWKLTPIMSYGKYPFVLVVKADAPWKTFKEFVDYIKKNPGKVAMAASRQYSTENFAMFMLQYQEKLDFKLIPYPGGAPAVAAVLGGHDDAYVGVSAMPQIREGRMRGLVTFGAERLPGFPDIPTFKDLGFDIVVESRLSIYGPPGMPKDIVKQLEETYRKAMDNEEFKKVVKSFEVDPSFLDGERVGKYHQELSAKIKTILDRMGIAKN
jgi:tripartite-type tricarboxylate transporter receptor subunit TctC